MMIIITGTPGVGKSTITEYIDEKYDNITSISINSLLENYDLNIGIDEKRGYKIVDTKSMVPIVDEIKHNTDKILIFEGHLAQDYPYADMTIILRCNPEILQQRLKKRRWTESKVHENVSAEILGICTQESYDTYGDNIQEIDTTDMNIDEVAQEIVKIIKGEKSYPYGEVDFLSDYFMLL